MATTQLPTKSEYENAVNELKKLNEDLFYDDFKEKIKLLESNILQLAMSNSDNFKKEAENVIRRAGMLFRQMETQKQEVQELLEANRSDIVQSNQRFLEEERTQLLFVYEELQSSLLKFTEKTTEMYKAVASSNKDLVDKALGSISSVADGIAAFTQELSVSDERNRQFLEQNEAFVTLTKEQFTQTEEKLAAHALALQQMDYHLEKLQKSYQDMFQRHTDSIKSILVVREEALIDKVTHQLESWKQNQAEQAEMWKREMVIRQEEMSSFIQDQGKQNHKLLQSVAREMSSKEDIAKIEKKNAWKVNLLLSVVVIEAVLIGIRFFI
ncbi:hypothetical protein [Neobacillus drentensis]|uniref:hypothetical protein n=1 Tax=Neobacillus drentensis TaxID=220684 RepID=UPI002FFEE92E